MEENRPLPMFRCEQIESKKLAKAWREWKGSLEYYFDSYEINDQKIKRSKMLHLGGPQLQKVFRSLEGTEDFPVVLLEKRYYDLAIERLDTYFKPRSQDVLERHILRNMKQGAEERFSHFVLRLRQQLNDCGLEKFTDEARSIVEELMIIDVIVEGCNSQELKRKILEKDRSLADIEALGESLESVNIQEKEMKVGSKTEVAGQSEICKIKSEKSTSDRRQERFAKRFVPRQNKTVENKSGVICYACGRYSHISTASECLAKGQQCRKCQKMGHFENVCRKRSLYTKGKSPPKKVQAIEDVSVPNDGAQVESENSNKVYYTFYTGSQANVFNCKIGGTMVEVFIDSGSEVNLITTETWEQMKSHQVVVSNCKKGSDKILKAYGSTDPLHILGTFEAVVEIGNKSTDAIFFVVDGGQRNLLGDATSKTLGILKIGLEVKAITETEKIKLAPFPKISGVKVRIQMDPNVKPVFQPLRRVPIPLETAINEKLEELLRRDIIEVKRGPATWVSPLVVATKANGTIRLCVDLRRVNQAVVRDRHPMPVIEEVIAKIGKGRIWSVLDVMDAFFLLELDEESRDIMTFITHRGLYRFKRLPFGLVSAPEIYQRTMDEILADCEGTYWYLDDVGIEGSTMEEHDARLEKVLQRFKERGVVLNWAKCKFRVSEFEFLGYKIALQGITPSDVKRDALATFRRPVNESEVRSFLGLANYMGKFIPNLAELDEPLRRLIQKGIKFQWGAAEEKAFIDIKSSLSRASCLGFFNSKDDTSVFADASPVALGAVLVQTNGKQEARVICYASKSLTETERRYCQTEKEALSLVWSVEKFQNYLIGRQFNLLTDCKALTFLFAPTSKPCARIERWVLRLQSFQYKIIYIPGHCNIADVLSRWTTFTPQAFDESEELIIKEIISSGTNTFALTWAEVVSASRVDPTITLVKEALTTDNFDNLPLCFKVILTELCFVDNVLLRGDRIVVPNKLQQRILQLAHEGHPGIRMMKAHLRANVWWPKMDQHVETFVKACRGCVLVSAPNPPEPMTRKELPSRPWEHIAIDFLGPLPEGENLLVCIDYYSRYLEVIEMQEITTKSVIKQLLILFSRYGIPSFLRADNGPQFSSEEFRSFCDEQGIHLESTIPYWPQMNGEVERQNRSILKRLRISQELGKDWRKELYQYLLTYHSAIHPTTGRSPAELMLGRRLRSKLPGVPSLVGNDEEARDHDMIEKEKGRLYADHRRRAQYSEIEVGDRVLAKRMRKENKLSSDFAPEEFVVMKKKGTDVMIRSSSSGKEFRRSAAHLKVIPHESTDGETLESIPVPDEVPIEESPIVLDQTQNENQTDASKPTQRSVRVRSEPTRLKDFITY
ncbi:uncharacterized protein K02A2.6-like [Uranotaenia lowii]|uniref:uncharacterized protein K02A2.6-like n=1 Tax=Uranotaenia lowii TaxID=190385 RepID=UPI0024784626|nr:uncharacterized protein K02A2.6-like [Uranotaenia lowii]XP_055585194.1 uncharacterized protein K02A2.6-like [Uranotaenia lowii]